MIRSKRRISIWFYLAGVLAGAGLFCASIVFLVLAKPAAAPTGPEPTAIITLILAPTSTQTLPANLFPTATPTAQSVVIGGIGKGLYVQISGTGGDGLRLRSSASISSDVRFIGYESEVFLVTDGPQNADGYVWWYLTAPYDESRSGWAAATYLAPLEIQP
jgi:hypothetical protein